VSECALYDIIEMRVCMCLNALYIIFFNESLCVSECALYFIFNVKAGICLCALFLILLE